MPHLKKDNKKNPLKKPSKNKNKTLFHNFNDFREIEKRRLT